MKKNYLWRGLTSVSAFVFAVVTFLSSLAFTRAGDVNRVLGTVPPTTEVTADTDYFPSSFDSKEEMREFVKASVIDTQIEGSVLMRNETAALPLAKNAKITLLGGGAADPIYNAAGGGSGDNTRVSLYTALKEEGFSINETVYEKLKATDTSYNRIGDIGEVPVSTYESVKGSFASYSDAAVIVLRRYGGEEGELNHGLDGIWQEGPVGVPELSLHQEEKDLLTMAKESGFQKVIVLLNSGYAMELGFLEEYGVDACLWMGYPGAYGFYGVADILSGDADPSGRTVDTYAASSLSAPAMQNAGDFQFTNLNTLYKNKYLVYQEGIYVGYKYYETRYADGVLNINNANSGAGKFASQGEAWSYADEMVYTFGHGISYASFTQELQELTWDQESHTVTAKVKVTNHGGYQGKSKSVVQLYAQLPWEAGMAEKSAIQLVDFAKTKSLGAGESEVVEITVSDYLFATYDENAVNGAEATKTGCYTFDKGDYYFAIGDNAHDALNNVLAKREVTGLFDEEGNSVTGNADKAVKVELAETDNVTYARSQRTDEVVFNKFDDRDLNYFIENSVTYLTRRDWNTFPAPIKNIAATEEIKDLIENEQYEKPADAPNISIYKFGQKNDIKFIEMKDVPYEDEQKWDAFIDQLTVNELCSWTGDHRGVGAIESVSMPAYSAGNGPAGIELGGILLNAQIVVASTFNKKVLARQGDILVEEAYYSAMRQIFGPGANLHRTPYSGRNAEYYSEDPIFSYLCASAQVGQMSKRGLVTILKHLSGNDQETNRHGVATFMTEQTYREVTLKSFEGAMASDEGASLGVMTAYNRIGCVPTACDYETIMLVTRGEWGFKGINMTDSSKDSVSYMSTADCVYGGSDQFCNDPDRATDIRKMLVNNKDGYIWGRLRQSAKNYFYAMSRSMLVNGLTVDVEVQEFIPWWQPALIALCVSVGVLTLGATGAFVYTAYFKKEEA